MVKANALPASSVALRLRHCASSPMLKPPQHGQASSSTSLSSVFSLVPYFRRHDSQGTPEQERFPLLTLKLSSPSFLDTIVHDDVTDRPLYTFKTTGSFTTVHRTDPWIGPVKTAEITWPKVFSEKGKTSLDGVQVYIRGNSFNGADSFLRRGAPRKFSIPNFMQSFKWRNVGTVYQCETSALKNPIAIFDPSDDASCPRLTVYETFHDKYDPHPHLLHQGVSVLLLDYLLCSALFLVTDSDDWMQLEKLTQVDVNITSEDSPLSSTATTLITPRSPKSTAGSVSSPSSMQWRKILYGEPLYTKELRRKSSTSSTSDNMFPLHRLSADRMAKLAYGYPLYPKIRTSSPDLLASDSDEDDSSQLFSPVRTQPSSPTVESNLSDPPLTASTFNTSNEDIPQFCNEPLRASSPYQPSTPLSSPDSTATARAGPVPSSPPVRVIQRSPPIYNISISSSRSRPTTCSSNFTTTTATATQDAMTTPVRDLPDLPPIAPLIPRPRSTPPRAMTGPTGASSVSTTQDCGDTKKEKKNVPLKETLPLTLHSSSTAAIYVQQPSRRPSRQLPVPPISGLPNTASNITLIGNCSVSPPSTPAAEPTDPLGSRSRSRSCSENQNQLETVEQKHARSRSSQGAPVPKSPPHHHQHHYHNRQLPAPPPTAWARNSANLGRGLGITTSGLGSEFDAGSLHFQQCHELDQGLYIRSHNHVAGQPSSAPIHLLVKDLSLCCSRTANGGALYDIPPPAYSSINFSGSDHEPRTAPPSMSENDERCTCERSR